MDGHEQIGREGRGFALLGRIAALAAGDTGLEQSLSAALHEICVHTGWPVGHAGAVRGGVVVGMPVWYGADEARFTAFKRASEELRARPGEGLPGKVLATARPAWVVDIARNASFARRVVAVEAGIRSALAFPLLSDGEVAGVLELFTPQLVEPNEELLGLLRVIGVELGRMTGHARAESLLRDGEERYRVLFESATDAIFLEDVDGLIISANPAAERLTGYRADELSGRPIEDLLAPEWREQSRIHHERKINGKVAQTHHESVILDRRGQRHTVEVSSAVILDNGAAIGVQAVARDLSERRRSEVALRESEERFRGAFDAAAIGMSLGTPDGRWLKVNDSFCRIVGYDVDELLEMRFHDITHPDDLEPDLQMARQLLAGEFSSYQMEKRYIRKDGQIVWIHLSVSLVRDADGAALYSVAQVLDISDRKRLELGAASVDARRAAVGTLSPRERQVLGLLADGETSAGAAVALGIGEETIQTHVRRAMAKLNARTRTEAVAIALRLGLLEGPAAIAA